MTKIESSVYTVLAPQATVYTRLSDLSGLGSVADRIPQDQMAIESYDADSVTLRIDPVGRVVLRVVERTPQKCVKMSTTESPLPFDLWVQMLPIDEQTSKIKVTVGLEINIVMAAMIRKPIEEGVEKMAQALATVFNNTQQ